MLTFRNTDMFGLVIPKDAYATIYSENEFVTEVENITTSALSGGYQRDQFVARAASVSNNNLQECSSYSEITTNLHSSVPLLISPERVIMVRKATVSNFTAFLGVFSFHFQPFEPGRADFQVIQMAGNSIELSLPFLSNLQQVADFLLVANKEFTLKFSDPNNINFGGGKTASDLSFLQGDLSSRSLNLISIMSGAFVKIHPGWGTLEYYTPGRFLRLEMTADAVVRDFREGVRITPIPGATEVNYYVPNNLTERFGTLKADTSVEVTRVDEKGQLYINVSNQEYIIDAWLTQPVQ